MKVFTNFYFLLLLFLYLSQPLYSTNTTERHYSDLNEMTVENLPWLESFENGGFNPSGWTTYYNSNYKWLFKKSTPTSSTGPQNGDHTTGSGYFAFTEASSSFSGAQAKLTSPILDISSVPFPQLVFWYNMYGYQIGTLEVEISTDGITWNNIFSLSGNQGTAWTEVEIPLGNYAGSTNLKIRFVGTRGSGSRGDIAIDDVTIIDAPSCLPPSNILTNNITFNSAELSWEEENTNSNSTISWDIEYGTAGFSQGNGTLLNTILDNPYVISGLLPNTEYEFYVRTDCGTVNGRSSWAGPFEFTTTCSPVTTPYCETFNPEIDNGFCWTVIDASGSTDFWYGNSSTAISGEEDAYIHTAGNNYLVSPPIALTGNESLQFWHKTALEPNSFEVLISTTGNSISEFTNTLMPFTSFSNTDYQEQVISLSSYSGTVFIAFHSQSGSNNISSSLHLDDICITSCLAPQAEAASNVSQSAVYLNWAENSNAMSWDIEWGEAGFEQGTGTIIAGVNSTPFQLNNLTSNTEYDYYVRSNCGINGNSNWSEKSTFETPCETLTTPYCESFDTESSHEACWTIVDANNDGSSWLLNSGVSNSGNQGAKMATYSNGGNNDDYLISPPIMLTGNESLQFWHRVAISFFPNNFEILLSTTGNNPSDFTNILLPDALYSNTEYQEQVVSLSSYTGTVFIAFHIPEGNTGFNLYIDDICITSCLAPFADMPSDINQTSANLNWIENNDTDLWDIEWGEAGFTQGTGTMITGISNRPFLLTNLASDTEYDYYIRSNCGTNGGSLWSEKSTFKTLCDALTTPYCESFDIGSNHKSCWKVIDANNDGDSWLLNSSSSNTGNKGIEIFTNGNGGNNDDYLISPQITLTGSESLQFWYRSYSFYDPNNFEVLLSTTGSDPSDFNHILMPNTTCYYTTYQEQVIDLSDYTGNVFIAFHIPYDGLDGSKFYLDDICVSSCLRSVNELNATNITSSSANLSWNTDSEETYWDVELSIAGTALGDGILISDHTYTSYYATGLESLTPYQFYVRAKCSEFNSVWHGPYYFTTDCNVADPVPIASSTSIGCNGSTTISAITPNDRQINVYADPQGTELLGEIPYLASPTSTTTYYLAETPKFPDNSGIYIDRFLTDPDMFGITVSDSGLTGSYEIIISDGYDDINTPNPVSHVLTAPTPGSYTWVDDSPASPNYWGDNIDWKVGEGDENGGWIIIVDITIPESPVVMDAVFWSYTEETIQGFNITTPQGIVVTDSGWNGHGVSHSCGDIVFRNAQPDANNISNWICGDACISNMVPITINVDPCIIAPGVTNECTLGDEEVMVDGTGGTGNWINIKAGGDIIAAIENTENLGLVSASFYKHDNGDRISDNLQNILPRNITINVSHQPINPIKVRLFFLDGEYDDLQLADDVFNTTSEISDLLITKYPNGNCSPSHVSAGLGAILVPNTSQGVALNGRFIETTVSSFSEFFIHEAGSNIPLPVELIKFDAKKDGEWSLLAWETASETNNRGFHIQRSSDGTSFEDIGWVNGEGNSSTQKAYEFTDKNPLDGINYYRLAQEDFDESINYSHVEKVSFKYDFDFALIPNPSKAGRSTYIQMHGNINQEISINVRDISGQFVKSIKEELKRGENNIKLSHDNMTGGVYVVSITNGVLSKSIKLVLVE